MLNLAYENNIDTNSENLKLNSGIVKCFFKAKLHANSESNPLQVTLIKKQKS